jgi:hypothetical protein
LVAAWAAPATQVRRARAARNVGRIIASSDPDRLPC